MKHRETSVKHKKICPKCRAKHARKHSYCGPCHAENMRGWRAERVTLTKGELKRLLMLAQPEEL